MDIPCESDTAATNHRGGKVVTPSGDYLPQAFVSPAMFPKTDERPVPFA